MNSLKLLSGASYKDKWWKNITEMFKTMNGEFKGDKTYIDWKVGSHDSQVIASFYEQWSVYLKPTQSLYLVFTVIPEYIAKFLYSFSVAIEEVFQNVFRLFGIFDYLGNDNSFIGQIYGWLRILGLTLFFLFLVVRIIMSFVTTPFRYKEFFNHLILVSFSTSFLPQAVSSFARLIYTDSSTLMSTTTTGSTSISSMSLQPFQNNVTDLLVLIDNKFDAEKLGRTVGDDGYVNPSNGVLLNKLTDKNIHSTNFAQSYGANNKEILEFFKKEGKDSAHPYYGIAALLSSELKTNEYNDDGSPKIVEVAGYKPASIAVFKNAFIPVYKRFTVSWIPLIIQLMLLILLQIAIMVSWVQSIHRVGLSTTVAPIVGYTSVENSTKFLELLQSIFAGMSGIWFETLIIKYGFWFIATAPVTVFQGFNFFHGLGFMGKSVATIVLYLSVFLATIQGSKAIESWLGIQTGARSGLIPTLGVAYGAKKLAKGLTGATIGHRDIYGKRHGGSLYHGGKEALGGIKSFAGFAIKRASQVAGVAIGAGRAVLEEGGAALYNYRDNTALKVSEGVSKGLFYGGKTLNRNVRRPFATASVQAFNYGTRNNRTGLTYQNGRVVEPVRHDRVRQVASGPFVFNKIGSGGLRAIDGFAEKANQVPHVKATPQVTKEPTWKSQHRADVLPREVKYGSPAGSVKQTQSFNNQSRRNPKPEAFRPTQPQTLPSSPPTVENILTGTVSNGSQNLPVRQSTKAQSTKPALSGRGTTKQEVADQAPINEPQLVQKSVDQRSFPRKDKGEILSKKGIGQKSDF